MAPLGGHLGQNVVQKGFRNEVQKESKRKLKRGIYDHDKAQKLWMYLIDDGAKEYVKEFHPNEDVAYRFPKETRLHLASVMAQRELDKIKQGEYPDAPKGTIS